MTIKSRNLNFDILRIMAAGFVFLVHLGQFCGHPRHGENGFYGVWLFFIMSGYLIYASLDGYENLNSETLKEYFAKRIVRIIPLYWSILVVAWVYDLLKGVLLEGNSIEKMFGGVCGWKYLRYFVFGQMFVPSDNYDLWNNRYVLWTMSAFAFFYVLAPFIKMIADSFWKSLAVLLIFFEIKVYLPEIIRNTFIERYGDALESFPELNPLCVMYLFWIGVCSYYAVKEGKQIIYGCLLTISFVFYLFRGNEYDLIFSFLVMISATTVTEVKNEKVSSLIELMSKCSFPLYLTHIIWFHIVAGISSFAGFGTIIKLPLMVGGSIIISFITYKLITPVEKRLGRILLERPK